MKILHTSDWHLGHILHNESQEEAQQDMLKQITEIIRKNEPDVLIISGDVYDTIQPSASIQQIFANSIVEMHNACPKMTIVCIAGNHDSGSKHMIFHTPWKALNVYMVGNIVKESNLEDFIIPIGDKGFVAAVPFAADRYMPDDVFKVLSEKIAERNANNLPVVLAAHLAVAKADWRGHDFSSDTNIGGLNCQELDIFGKDYDYIALGHIHKKQQLDKKGRIWYSGTPIAVSFDESYSGDEHGVLLVDSPRHGEKVKVTTIPITNIHPLVNLPSDRFADWETVKEMLVKYDKDISSIIRLNVEVEDYLSAGANDEAQQIVKDKKCHLCVINSKRKDRPNQNAKAKALTTTQLKQIDFMDVVKMYMESKGEVFDDDIKQMLQEIKNSLTVNS